MNDLLAFWIHGLLGILAGLVVCTIGQLVWWGLKGKRG